MASKIAFIGNQGGREVVSIYAGMARILIDEFGITARFAVWLDSERQAPAELGVNEAEVSSFEEFVRCMPGADRSAVDQLVREYREVNWSEVVAAERAFTDYSMLLGAAGDRRESPMYVQSLVVAIVRYLERVMEGCDAVVCQTADTLFSLVVFKVAHHLRIPVYAIAPAWLLEPGKGGGFFANSEFLECRRMLASFRARQSRSLSLEERMRIESLVQSIKFFDGKTAYSSATSKGQSAGRSALTPNLVRLLPYLAQQARQAKNVVYTKIDPIKKVRANLLRLIRKQTTRNMYGPVTGDGIPSRSVFYAIHYQPEQSTLAQGIWHVNQVALVENISKSLPLGYTLVVKEHPWGRGNRPRWQYTHMAGFYNVMFCDAPAKEIIRRVEAVVAVSGTVAMEALVLDRPTVVLGRNFFEFCDLLYRVRDVQDLPEVLARILVDGDYRRQTDRDERLSRFLMAYLDGLVPCFPVKEHGKEWGRALAGELGLAQDFASNHPQVSLA
jgi:Capsule polysaccharide biosynthesis protein